MSLHDGNDSLYSTPDDETHTVKRKDICDNMWYFEHTDADGRIVTYGKQNTTMKSLTPLQVFHVNQITRSMDMSFLQGSLIPMIRQEHPISLRILDWTMTNYAATHNVMYVHKGDIVVLHDVYRNCLKLHGKRNYDPFRRRWRLFMQFDDTVYTTTPAQLNFFFYAQKYGVISFAMANKSDIEEDMNTCLARARKRKGQKRRRLCHASAPSQRKIWVFNGPPK